MEHYPQASRRTDPDSSRLAEYEATVSGSRKKQQDIIFNIIKARPGLTSKEMTHYCNLDRYQIARRTADLKDCGLVYQGPIRICTIGGRKSVTWFPVSASRQQMSLF